MVRRGDYDVKKTYLSLFNGVTYTMISAAILTCVDLAFNAFMLCIPL